MFKKKILIIDDTKLMVKLISDILEEQDYNVVSAVVTNKMRSLENHIHVAEIAAELKKEAKSIQGSIYIEDKHKG
jgi:CheY-like chemotaxis protein